MDKIKAPKGALVLSIFYLEGLIQFAMAQPLLSLNLPIKMMIKSIKNQIETIPIKTSPIPKKDVSQPKIAKINMMIAVTIRPA